MDTLSLASHCVCAFTLLAIYVPEVVPYPDTYVNGIPVESQGPNQNPYLWFGPRLGRRKRTIDEDSLPKNSVIEDSVISAFEDTPWALVPMKSFQERPLMSRDVEEIPDSAKAPPFAPRLGRRRKLLPFSPRLGRDLAPEPIDRYKRSAKTIQ